MNSTKFKVWLIAGDTVNPVDIICDDVIPSSVGGGYYHFFNGTSDDSETVAVYPIERTAIVEIIPLTKESPAKINHNVTSL